MEGARIKISGRRVQLPWHVIAAIHSAAPVWPHDKFLLLRVPRYSAGSPTPCASSVRCRSPPSALHPPSRARLRPATEELKRTTAHRLKGRLYIYAAHTRGEVEGPAPTFMFVHMFSSHLRFRGPAAGLHGSAAAPHRTAPTVFSAPTFPRFGSSFCKQILISTDLVPIHDPRESWSTL